MTRVRKANMATIVAGIIILLVSAIFVFIAVERVLSWNKFIKTAAETTAKITQIEARRTGTGKHRKTRHIVHIEYTVDGVKYRNTLGEYSSFMHKGDIVNICYDPADPEKIMTPPYFMCAILGGVSFIFICVAVLLLVSELRNNFRAKRLADDNIYVLCDNWEYAQANIRVNKVRYINVICKYSDGFGFNTEFASAAFHPRKSPFTPGQAIKVYVDSESSPSIYYIPLDED